MGNTKMSSSMRLLENSRPGLVVFTLLLRTATASVSAEDAFAGMQPANVNDAATQEILNEIQNAGTYLVQGSAADNAGPFETTVNFTASSVSSNGTALLKGNYNPSVSECWGPCGLYMLQQDSAGDYFLTDVNQDNSDSVNAGWQICKVNTPDISLDCTIEGVYEGEPYKDTSTMVPIDQLPS